MKTKGTIFSCTIALAILAFASATAHGAPCPACLGRGRCNWTKCKGRGSYYVSAYNSRVSCPKCAGTGKCGKCQGSGKAPPTAAERLQAERADIIEVTGGNHRVWTSSKGDEIEAVLRGVGSIWVILKTSGGDTKRIRRKMLSAQDTVFLVDFDRVTEAVIKAKKARYYGEAINILKAAVLKHPSAPNLQTAITLQKKYESDLAYDQAQQAKGLVKLNGRWVTKEQATSRRRSTSYSSSSSRSSGGNWYPTYSQAKRAADAANQMQQGQLDAAVESARSGSGSWTGSQPLQYYYVVSSGNGWSVTSRLR